MLSLALLALAARAGAGDSGVTASDGSVGLHALPLVAWRSFDRSAYRAGLRDGTLGPGLVVDRPLRPAMPTVLFIHGAAGAPRQFAALASFLSDRANTAAFLYDDHARLVESADLLRRELLRFDGRLLIVAHSMGALLVARAGSGDCDGRLRDIAVVYLNPLIGGSHYADDIPALRWLRPLRPVLQHLFFPPSVKDLTPESDFEQAIFGARSPAPCFASRTVLLFTERPGEEPDITQERVPRFFTRTRQQLLSRLGEVVTPQPGHETGHNAPLDHPDLSRPLINAALERVSALYATNDGDPSRSTTVQGDRSRPDGRAAVVRAAARASEVDLPPPDVRGAVARTSGLERDR